MGTTVINAYTYPEATDPPVTPADLRRVLEQVAQGGVMRFSSTAERTAAFAALGQSPTPGMLSFLASTGRHEWYTAVAAWCAVPGTAVGRARRESNSSTTTTVEIGVLRLDSVPIVSGQLYTVTLSPIIFNSTVANDLIEAHLRYSTAGAATTGSTALGSVVENSQSASLSQKTKGGTFQYLATVTGSLSVLLSFARTSGTGTVSILGSAPYPIELAITVAGTDPGDTGVDI